ncbi:hypothetical protein [uncultured Eudoraea sp.]|uniref:hypothetical protein n=1 Tax=uncultured Eudoraea sp. TaxID=1035614 RepID=UPI002638023E|nr:hypothetical protein [uncultured Eudoraea sp.]
MNKLRELIAKNIAGKKVAFLFVLTNLIYAFMLLVTIPKTVAYSGGMKLLDMMPQGYGSEYVNELFGKLGQEGRDAYLFNQIPVDMIYPLLFAITYSLLIAYFLKKLDKLNTSFFFLCLIPIIAGIADYLENIGIVTMLNSYPDLSVAQISTTNIFSIIKSVSTTLFFIVLIVIIILVAIKWLKLKRSGE